MFVDTFITRPILATVCSLVIVLAGGLAIPLMPIAQYPDVTPPTVTVTSVYTGANAETVETAVTTPLEQALNGVEGMRYISSASSNSGFSQITVTFDINRNPDLAAVDVQNRVNQALGRLPAEVRQIGVTVQKASSNFVLAIAIYARDGRYDSLFVSNYLDVYVKDALKRVAGVADVQLFGERKYSMRLWLDPVRLAARQLTAGDVVNALREQNVNVAAGSVGDSPARAGQTYQMSVRATGRLRESREFEDIIVKAGADGSLIRLRDVGTAELGAETYSSALRFQSVEAKGFAVEAQGFAIVALPTANALDVKEGVVAELARMSRTFPPGIEYNIAFDTTTVVEESIREVIKTLAEAIGLVVLVMFVFLQSWRATLIPALTLPVSLVGAFAFVHLLGFSINTLTLFAVVLATGIVVDDAIVVIENIERHIQEFRKPALQAASDAMREVFGAVIATAIVLIAVFVPVGFFPGTTGRLYQQFALTIAFAVAISAFNAVTLTPALSAVLLKHDADKKGRFFGSVERLIHAGTGLYVRIVGGLVRVRWAMVVLFAGLLGLTYFVYTRVPQAFVPEEDAGYFIAIVQGPAGASLEYTTNVLKQAEQLLAKVPEVETVFSIAGFSFAGSAPNQGLIFTLLKPFAVREEPEKRIQGLLPKIRGMLFGIDDALVIAFAPPSIQGLGNFGGFTMEVLDQSGRGNIQELGAGTQALVGAAQQSQIVTGMFSGFTANDPQLAVDIDREKARSLGLPIGEITSAMQIYLGSAYVNDFDFNNRAYRVYVQADKAFRSEPRDLGQYYARTDRGQMVPLASVVRVRETAGPQVISHFNLFRSAQVNGAAAPGFSSGEAIAEAARLGDTALPPGFGYAWSGITFEEVQAGGQSAAIFGIGMLLVYLALAAQYESFVLPFIVLLGVPLAILGALSAQWFRGLQNDIYCQIGLVMLIGLAAKNSILIVEFAEQLRGRGLSVVEAAIEAARIRLRPILMTSLAFILGVMPLVFAGGAGQEGRHSVGTAVAGGMFFATFLNILFIPILYVVIQTLRGSGRRATGSGPVQA
jgi:hydrophobic/amphiphilic exporter-1 (mainly G- bacteria), HAE1 family